MVMDRGCQEAGMSMSITPVELVLYVEFVAAV